MERQRVRRRLRLPSTTRSRIRLRVWLACTGALLVMAVGIYLAIGHDGASGGRVLPHGQSDVAAAAGPATTSI